MSLRSSSQQSPDMSNAIGSSRESNPWRRIYDLRAVSEGNVADGGLGLLQRPIIEKYRYRTVICLNVSKHQSVRLDHPWGSRGKLLELGPPSILILCDGELMFCLYAKARPTKIYVISPSSSGTASRPSTNPPTVVFFFGFFFSGTFVSPVQCSYQLPFW